MVSHIRGRYDCILYIVCGIHDALYAEFCILYMNTASGAESTLNVGGVFQHFSQFFGNFRKSGVYCVIKFGAVTKFGWDKISVVTKYGV